MFVLHSLQGDVLLGDDADAGPRIIDDRNAAHLRVPHARQTEGEIIFRMTGDRFGMEEGREPDGFRVFAGGHDVQAQIAVGDDSQQPIRLGIDDGDDAHIFFRHDQRSRLHSRLRRTGRRMRSHHLFALHT